MRPGARGAATWRALALLLPLAGAAACVSARPEVKSARRAEAEAERPPLPPPVAAPRPKPAAPAPKPMPAAVAARPRDVAARPFAELAGPDGAPRADLLAVLDDLRFAPGSAILDGRSRALLDGLAARLRGLGAPYRIEVQGHADATGDELGNLELALARAEAVRNHLRRDPRLAAERISIVAIGSAQPVGDNATAAGRAWNRRAVVLVSR